MTSAVSDFQPPLKRASFTFHVCSIAGLDRERLLPAPFPLTYTVKLLDEVLDLFDNDTRFQYLTLDGETKPLEDYLSVRPENFERIEQAVQEGQLLIGPLYVNIHPVFASREALIRNLIIGLRTARAFGQPMLVGYIGKSELRAYIPQIFRSFGIETLIAEMGLSHHSTMENVWHGNDGTRITLVYVLEANDDSEIASFRDQYSTRSASGQLMVQHHWDMHCTRAERFNALTTVIRDMYSPVDESLQSNPTAYATAIYKEQNKVVYGEIRQQNSIEAEVPIRERLLTVLLEPFVAWADALPHVQNEEHVRHLQHLIRKLWKEYLETLNDDPNWQHPNSLDKVCYHLSRVAAEDIACHIDTAALPVESERVLVLFNPNPYQMHATIEIRKDAAGILPVTYNKAGELCSTVTRRTKQYRFKVDVPALGYECYSISSEPQEMMHEIRSSDRNMLFLHTVFTDRHTGSLPLSTSLLQVSDPNFNLSALKPPEDSDRTGLIVRGYNTASEPLWITLTPFRSFAVVEVVTMDEVPTGGQLAPEDNGAITFRALPQHILTFWFHD